MLGVDWLVTTALVFIVTALVVHLAIKRRSKIPGPYGLPLLGYLPFLGKAPHKTFAKLASKYGPVFRIFLGTEEFVVLNSFEAIKDSFIRQNDVFSGRPDGISFKVFHDETAFVFKEGEEWKESRMFCVSSLKELGFGKQSLLEPIVQDEIQYFLKELEKQQTPSGTTPISNILKLSVGNAICSILIGSRSNYDDPWLNDLAGVTGEIQNTYVNDIKFFFPWMNKIPFLAKWFEVPEKTSLKSRLHDLLKQKVEEIKKQGNTGNISLVSMWLDEQNKRKKIDGNDNSYSDFDIVCNVDLLCQWTFETTATSLHWALINLVKEPLLQERIHKEIDDVIGQDKYPTYNDTKSMPYTRAFIQENHRKASIFPTGVYHVNREEASVLGQHIEKKRTIIIPNLWAVHYDPKVFPEPENFDPTRFLDKNGEFVKHESVIPFSVGKRFCVGEYVAQMEIFLYLTCLLQKYRLEVSEGQEFKAAGCDATVLHHPEPFNLVLRKK